jgi:hypothetical protein
MLHGGHEFSLFQDRFRDWAVDQMPEPDVADRWPST